MYKNDLFIDVGTVVIITAQHRAYECETRGIRFGLCTEGGEEMELLEEMDRVERGDSWRPGTPLHVAPSSVGIAVEVVRDASPYNTH